MQREEGRWRRKGSREENRFQIALFCLIVFFCVHKGHLQLFVLRSITIFSPLQRPSLEMVAAWVDPETVSLLIGMVD